MNAYSLIKRLRNARWWFHLSLMEQGLFHELIDLCNQAGWKQWFSCSNKQLCLNLNISDNTLRQLRSKLVEVGLLGYRSGKNRFQPGTYSFTEGIELPADFQPHFTPSPDAPEESSTPSQNVDRTPSPNADINKTNNKTKKEEINKEEKKSRKEPELKQQFDDFRKEYPGSKRGLDTEYDYLRRKHADYREVIPLLLPALIRLKKWRNKRMERGEFVPEYPNLKTWIYNRRWEDEQPNDNVYDYEY